MATEWSVTSAVDNQSWLTLLKSLYMTQLIVVCPCFMDSQLVNKRALRMNHVKGPEST